MLVPAHVSSDATVEKLALSVPDRELPGDPVKSIVNDRGIFFHPLIP
jgi:hypothetical protein